MALARRCAPDAPAPTHRSRTRGLLAAGAAVAAALVPSLAALPAWASSGTMLLQDDFKGASVVSTAYLAGGTFATCLTASTATSSSPIPGCATTAIDASGSGALRLTKAGGGESGYLLYDKALPTKAGLDITFNQYQYGGTGADGISFFLTDGAYTLSAPGPSGGSLGYDNNSSTAGVAHALLGVGFDVYGNFPVETNNAACGTSYISGGATDHKSSVAVRGPGNGSTGYCLLGSPVSTVSSAAAVNLHSGSSTRPTAIVTRVVIDPPSASSPKVTVYLNGAQVTQVAEPSVLAATPTFKFGWAASTGGSTDIHEINFLSVQSVNPIVPDLSLAAPGSSYVVSGQAPSLTWTPKTSAAAGPIPANETVTFSATAPAGTTFSVASGTGWTCSGTGTAALSCTRTSTAAVDPGTTLPTVTTALTRTTAGTSGTGTVSATVTSTTDDPSLTGDNSATGTVGWYPVAADVQGAAVAASATPATSVVAPSVTGTGPFSYAVSGVTGPGTVVYNTASGTFHVTPTAGASGLITATYVATDPSGLGSNSAKVTMDVTPVGVGSVVSGVAGQQLTTALNAPVGTGAFTATGTPTFSAGLSAATVSVVGGVPTLTATPAAGFSGTATVGYTLQDGVTTTGHARTTSATVTVTVRPAAGTTTGSTSLDASGDASLSTTLPTPTGIGPFTFSLVGNGGLGSAVSISPAGALTLAETAGASGVFPVTYTVTGAGGVSDPATATLTVNPYLAPVPVAVGTADATTTSAVPTLLGTGTPTWQVGTAPTGTTVTVDGQGRVTLDPQGHSGTFAVPLTGTANGASSTTTVTFEVHPVAHAVSGQTTASAHPNQVDLFPTLTGTGPFSTVVPSGLDPATGTTTPGNPDLFVTPAAGYSGTTCGQYRAVANGGLESDLAAFCLAVLPSQADSTGSLDSGTSGVVALPTPVGVGPFSYSITSGPAVGSATVDAQGAHVTVPATYSGALTVHYTVTDASGLVSTPATLTVTVRPTASAGRVSTTAVPPGTTATGVAGPAPTPSGTGPFTAYELVTTPDPSQGTATIDPTTGVVTVVPTAGYSGTVTLTYRAKDADGTWTAPAAISFVVAPAPTAVPTGSAASVSTVSGGSVATSLPAPVGTGPFTYRLVTVPDVWTGTTTIDGTTGALRFTGNAGVSGRMSITYRVADASGQLSAPATVTVTVAPVVASTSIVVGHGATRVYQLPTPSGTGPFTWALTSLPTAAQGTATVDPASGVVTFVAAAAYTGDLTLAYTVTDAAGVTSAEAGLTVQVLAAGTTTTSSGTTTLAATGASVVGTDLLAIGCLVTGLLLVRVRRRRRG